MAGTCKCGNEPSGSIKCGKFRDYLENLFCFSKRTLLHGVSKYLVQPLSWCRGEGFFVLDRAQPVHESVGQCMIRCAADGINP